MVGGGWEEVVAECNVRGDTQVQGIVEVLRSDKWIQHGRNDQYIGYIVTLCYLFHSSLLINEDIMSHECVS